jgi:hypothetical protein
MKKGGEKPSECRAGKRKDRNKHVETRTPLLVYHLIVTDIERHIEVKFIGN